jgi:hypothetical protein
MRAAPDRSKTIRRAAGWGVGVLLLGASVVFALRGVSLADVVAVSPQTAGLLTALVLTNLLLTAALFWSITRSFPARPPVPFAVMAALIAVSNLLNYIPVVRAGLWGRAAYLKARHAFSVGSSLRVLGVVLGLAVLVVGGMGFIALAWPAMGVEWALRWQWVVVGWWGLLAIAVTFVAARWGGQGNATAAAWVPLRAADVGVATLRLWVCFDLLGITLGLREAAVLASASLLVKLAGLTPNGLGLSEWVVAGLSVVLAPVEAGVAAAAALIDRAVEVVVSVVAGSIGAGWLKLNRSPEPRPRARRVGA